MKIMVVHPGTQHSTKLAAAIKSGGNDVLLITTVYKKTGSLTNLIFRFFPDSEKKRINARRNEALDDQDILVSHEFLGIVLLVIARLDKRKKFYTKVKRIVAKAVGRHAASIAVKYKYDAVISFDSYSMYVFNHLDRKKYAGKKIIDYTAGFAPFVKDVYLDEIKMYPEMKSSFEAERPVLWDKKYFDDLYNEPKLCDRIICASHYTKRTLETYGVNNSIISIIPYGYNPKNNVEFPVKDKNIFTVLFVGNVSIMKGIPLLIQAFREISSQNIRLVLVGGIQDTVRKIAESDTRIVIKGHIPHSIIGQEYCKADLFVFPSLSDGFGFAPLEAMSYGVPCAVTESAGVSEVIQDGVDGFIIKQNSVDGIKNILEYCLSHKEILNKMSEAAKTKAAAYSIERYNYNIQNYFEQL